MKVFAYSGTENLKVLRIWMNCLFLYLSDFFKMQTKFFSRKKKFPKKKNFFSRKNFRVVKFGFLENKCKVIVGEEKISHVLNLHISDLFWFFCAVLHVVVFQMGRGVVEATASSGYATEPANSWRSWIPPFSSFQLQFISLNIEKY